MNYIILIIVGIVGIILGTYLGRRKVENVREKEKNKQKILKFFESRERVANNDVEKLLGVSDATATRYLDELEKQGEIRQVGKEGRFVYYERI